SLGNGAPLAPHSFPTRRSSDLARGRRLAAQASGEGDGQRYQLVVSGTNRGPRAVPRQCASGTRAGGCRPLDPAHPEGKLEQGARSEEHTSELQSREKLVCRLLL